MRVALVGCGSVATWGIGGEGDRPWERDDQPLDDALRARGCAVERPAWDDASVDWRRYDLALLRSPWNYHHHRDAFVAWAEEVERATRLVNPARIVRWNTVKTYLRDLDVPQPETVWVAPEEVDQLPDRVRERGWSRGFLKPVVGATAEGTLRFDADPAGLASAVAHVRAFAGGRPMMLQPYLPTVETAGERSAIAIGGEVTHWVRKQPVSGDYRVQDDYGATDAPHTPDEAERALVAATLRRLPEPLAYARVDWLVGEDGAPRLIELEVVEPCLFFRHGPHAAERLVEVLLG